MAEEIDLLFGLWTWVGRRKHKFNRIRQMAPMCPHGRHIDATWQMRLNGLSAAAMRSYVKLLWPLVIIVSKCLNGNFTATVSAVCIIMFVRHDLFRVPVVKAASIAITTL